MKVIYSDRYFTACVVPEEGDDYASVIERCYVERATYQEGSELEEPCFVVQLREDIGPELWTREALVKSLVE